MRDGPTVLIGTQLTNGRNGPAQQGLLGNTSRQIFSADVTYDAELELTVAAAVPGALRGPSGD
jgi:hypothetical protein